MKLKDNKFRDAVLYWFPTILTFYGVIVHFFGILKYTQVWTDHNVHIAMFVVDSLVVTGLLRKTKWGYWLAVILYVQQVIMQSYWTINYAYSSVGLGLFQFFVPAICLASLLVLMLRKNLFIS